MTNRRIDEFFDSIEAECISKSAAKGFAILAFIVGVVIGFLMGTSHV